MSQTSTKMWPFRRELKSVRAANHQDELAPLVGILSLLSDRNAFHGALTAYFRDAAECQSTIVFERDPERGQCVGVGQVGGQVVSGRTGFRADGTLVAWLTANRDYLRIPDDAGVFEYLNEEERQVLVAQQAQLCVPFLGREELVGLVLLSDGRADWHLPDEKAIFLLASGRHIGMACEDANRRRDADGRVQSLHRAGQLVVAGQLAAAVAHEVRNPLSTIRSTIQYVLRSPTEWAHKQELLSEMLNEVDRIDRTLSGMLSLSRPKDLFLTETDAQQVVQDAVTLIRSYAEEQHVEVEVRFGEPFTVLADLRELRQVFVNLLLNACQAMSEGGTLTVSSNIVSDPATGATSTYGAVRIADTGPGIPPDCRDKIFDPFYTTKIGGTGLGLPVCLEIVVRHQGRLDIVCPPGGGTVMSVLLPIKVS